MPTLLLIDDNTTLARFAGHMLRSAIDQLEVITAHTCAKAKDLAEEHPIDVVILDHRLPDGDGLSLLDDIRLVRPGVRAIVISGTVDPQALRKQSAIRGVTGFLSKPWEAEELVETVRRALAAEPVEAYSGPYRIAETRYVQFDRHRALNRLAGLLAGLRAFGADLRADADDPQAIHGYVDEYLERLVEAVREVADMLNAMKITSQDEV